MSSSLRRAGLLLALLVLAAACSRAPTDLRIWRPSDHDRTEEKAHAQSPTAANSAGGGALSQPAKMLGVDQVVLVTWRQNCTRCHGMLGRGDGPQGAMTGARNLSDPAWQASVTDAQIATAITKGKGRMPHFPLPAATVTGLIRLVRMMNADPSARPASVADAADGGPPTKAAKAARAHPVRRKPTQRPQ